MIIGSYKSKNNQDLLCEIKSRGHLGKIISQSKLLLEFDGRSNNFKVSCKGFNLDSYDIFIFRGYNVNKTEAQLVAEKCFFLGKWF